MADYHYGQIVTFNRKGEPYHGVYLPRHEDEEKPWVVEKANPETDADNGAPFRLSGVYAWADDGSVAFRDRDQALAIRYLTQEALGMLANCASDIRRDLENGVSAQDVDLTELASRFAEVARYIGRGQMTYG